MGKQAGAGKNRKEEGWARLGRQWASAGRREKGWADLVGLKREEDELFFKIKSFSKSIFSFLSQIQIEFEFNFESTSPTFNQKQYAPA